MTFQTVLIFANLALTLAIIAAAAAFGIKAYIKRKRARRAARRAATGSSIDYAARTNWKTRPTKLNYSSFVYLDVDRDGRYGLADRPMGGMIVRLSGAEGHLLKARSNGNGFANFTMSTTLRKAQIKSPGTYRFTVSVPPGWICTSQNDVQTMAFDHIEGAPAGIGALEMVKPVGLAPLRTLKGIVPKGEAIPLRFTNAEGQVGEAQLRPDAEFAVDVPEAAEAVEILGMRLHLSSYPTYLGRVSAGQLSLPPEAALETIDFNGVTPRGLRKVPNGYAGLNWFNLNVISRDFQAGNEGYVNGNTSGDHMCYTSSGHPGEIWSDVPFGFHSVMLSSAWLSSEGETCIVESWRGDELAARDEIVVSALAPVHYAPLLANITRVKFSSRHYWQIVLDDLVISR